MGNIIVLLVVVFLHSGAPLPSMKILPAGQTCDLHAALVAVSELSGSLGEPINPDIFLWNCSPVTSPGPYAPEQPATKRGA